MCYFYGYIVHGAGVISVSVCFLCKHIRRPYAAIHAAAILIATCVAHAYFRNVAEHITWQVRKIFFAILKSAGKIRNLFRENTDCIFMRLEPLLLQDKTH